MLSLIKWIWDKAEQRGRDQIIGELVGMATYHRNKAEIKTLRGKLSEDDTADLMPFSMPKLNPEQHSAVAGELYRLLERVEKHYNHESWGIDDGR